MIHEYKQMSLFSTNDGHTRILSTMDQLLLDFKSSLKYKIDNIKLSTYDKTDPRRYIEMCTVSQCADMHRIKVDSDMILGIELSCIRVCNNNGWPYFKDSSTYPTVVIESVIAISFPETTAYTLAQIPVNVILDKINRIRFPYFHLNKHARLYSKTYTVLDFNTDYNKNMDIDTISLMEQCCYTVCKNDGFFIPVKLVKHKDVTHITHNMYPLIVLEAVHEIVRTNSDTQIPRCPDVEYEYGFAHPSIGDVQNEQDEECPNSCGTYHKRRHVSL